MNEKKLERNENEERIYRLLVYSLLKYLNSQFEQEEAIEKTKGTIYAIF